MISPDTTCPSASTSDEKCHIQPRWLHRSMPVLLGLVTLLLFLPSIHFDFLIYDDPFYVTENKTVQSGLTLSGIIWAFTTDYASNWHLLAWLSLMTDCQLFGASSAWMHFTNVFLHATNTILLFELLRRMTRSFWCSVLVAALFAWHPLHVESVAWISERKDVLSTFFWLLTLSAYVLYAERPGRFLYILALLCFAFGLMAKPMVVTLPFVLFLLDFWPLRRISTPSWLAIPESATPAIRPQPLPLSKLIREKIPFLALSAVCSGATFLAQRNGGSVAGLDGIPLRWRVATALVSYCRYLVRLFWPAHLAAPYPHPGRWPLWMVAAAGVVLLVVSIVALRCLRRQPFFFFGWLWFLGTAIPVIGIVQVGSQAMADRYTYIPLIGIFIMLAWGMAELVRHCNWSRPALVATSTISLGACLVLTSKQIQVWRNSETLFRHSISVTEGNVIAHTCLGIHLSRLGRVDEAIEEHQKALQIYPSFFDAHYNLGHDLILKGRFEEAIDHLKTSLQLAPNYAEAHDQLGLVLSKVGRNEESLSHYHEAVRLNPGLAIAHLHLGDALVSLDRPAEAQAHLMTAIQIQPALQETYKSFGKLLLNQGRPAEALQHFRKAVELRPQEAEAQYYLGLSLSMEGKTEEALESYQQAITLNDTYPTALNDLAWLLATSRKPELRDGKEALRLAKRACDISQSKEPRFLGTLDAAYAQAGMYEEAINAALATQKLALSLGEKAVAEAAEKRLSLYKTRSPYIEE